jgi:hypothetical protein
MSNNNTANINIEAVIAKRKEEWMKEARKTISIQERVALSVPWWLIIIAAGLFALSAGHTAGVFLELSSVGYAGPFVVEFALLWAAFARVNVSGKVSLALRVLEVLAFIIAIFVNAIGAISRVAAIAKIDSFSFGALSAQYATLPLATQAVLLFVPLFALFIPIGTWVAGEGLAELFLKQRQSGTLLEQRWREAEILEVYRALYQAYIQSGMKPVQARRQSQTIANGLTRGGNQPPQLPAKILPNEANDANQGEPNGIAIELPAKDRVWAYLDEFGPNVKVAEVANAVQVSGETAWRWMKKYREQNGESK